jgi:metal-responsive CopG/Arc/MetJ family transcriptional regulator
MAEATTPVTISGMPITLLSEIDAAAKADISDRSKFIIKTMRDKVSRKKKKSGAGGRADGASR